jgi:hypothetical protein
MHTAVTNSAERTSAEEARQKRVRASYFHALCGNDRHRGTPTCIAPIGRPQPAASYSYDSFVQQSVVVFGNALGSVWSCKTQWGMITVINEEDYSAKNNNADDDDDDDDSNLLQQCHGFTKDWSPTRSCGSLSHFRFLDQASGCTNVPTQSSQHSRYVRTRTRVGTGIHVHTP